MFETRAWHTFLGSLRPDTSTPGATVGYCMIVNLPLRFLHSSAAMSEVSNRAVMSMDKNVSIGSQSKTVLDYQIH